MAPNPATDFHRSRPERCPADAAPLVTHRHAASIVSRCPACHGVFIPATTVRELHDFTRLERRRGIGDADPAPARKPVSCPADGSRMEALHFKGVEIDRCPQCLGIWLDPGELDAIRARRRRSKADDDSDPGDAADASDAASDLGDALEFVGDAIGGLLDGISL